MACLLVGGATLIALAALALQPSTIDTTGAVAFGRGPVRVAPPNAARVIKITVAPNSAVKKGQVLAILSNSQDYNDGATDADRELEAIAEQLQAMQAQEQEDRSLGSTKRDDLTAQIQLEQEAVRTYENQLPAMRDAIRSAEETLAEYRALSAKGYVRRPDLRARERDVFTLKRELATLNLDVATRRSSLLTYRRQLGTLGQSESSLSKKRASEKASLLAKQQGAAARKSYPLLSPVDGTVRFDAAQVGVLANPGETLFLVDPKTSRYNVIARLPASETTYVTVGTKARIWTPSTSSRDAHAYRGTVLEVQRQQASEDETQESYSIVIGGIEPTQAYTPLPPAGSEVRVSFAVPDSGSIFAGIRRFFDFSGR